MKTIYTLPVPSTSLLNDAEFEMQLGRTCTLSCEYEHQGEINNVLTMFFDGVEAFRCTYYRAVSLDLLEAYDKVVDLGETEWLRDLRNNLTECKMDATSLSHLATYFDDGPAYEFICRAFHTDIKTRRRI